ncbi:MULTISPECIES: cytochrome d ubiquinol oxidase subunit II [Proteus]|uniref:cytochrome d ubiquinol oxidase subunit II n=1 Tax=Proteus TaxID=583 RepID=UPI0015993E06|nr:MULTISPECIES: cytochrome d ubiquinol oxidase subunit II [Proteus]QKJ49093.1 cytochrome d ubiquinol oxidase subunit II [Proteus vulgaris]GLX64567.1 ubiquinol oxidase subunit II, cyanide insensitive [Proteus vulgaris]
MNIDFSIIWFAIIIFATLMYIIADGFDLGIGIILPFTKDKIQRDTMINSVAPVWDGNETWLVLGGAALYGAFPLAYAVIIDALTIPLTLMLIGLIFRGVAFEFRVNALPKHRLFWDSAFIGGSFLATFCQGVTVGAVINGFEVTGRSFSGSALDWLSPFPLFCGFALLITYALLGSSWLIMKTEHQLHRKMCSITVYLAIALLVAIAIVSLWTPLAHEDIAQRWFSLPNLFFLLPVPLFVLVCTWGIVRSAYNYGHYLPFVFSLFLVLIGFSGLGVSIFPNIIPPTISIWDAASPVLSQKFMLVGAVIIIPVILMYTSWSYYVFRGKVNPNESYH